MPSSAMVDAEYNPAQQMQGQQQQALYQNFLQRQNQPRKSEAELQAMADANDRAQAERFARMSPQQMAELQRSVYDDSGMGRGAPPLTQAQFTNNLQQAGFGQLMGGPMGGLLNRPHQGPGPGQFGYGSGTGGAPQMNRQQSQILRDRVNQFQQQQPRGMTMDMPQRYGRQPSPPPNPYQMYGGLGSLMQPQSPMTMDYNPERDGAFSSGQNYYAYA